MFFKNDKSKITDFIEKNEENISKKEISQDKLILSASDMVDETAKTIIMPKVEENSEKHDNNSLEKNNLSDNQIEENILNEKTKQEETSYNKDDIDKKVKEFYEEYKKPDSSQEEYNRSTPKEKAPSYENMAHSQLNIYIQNTMYAGFWLRSFAYIIDIIIVIGIKNILQYVDMMPQDKILNGLMLYIIFVIYNFILVYLTNGYTIGKIIMNIKVVSAKNENISFLTAFTREFIGKYILIKLPIIFCFLVFSPKKHHLIDYLSDTDVIKEKYEKYFRNIQ